jgi:hypothetical protein
MTNAPAKPFFLLGLLILSASMALGQESKLEPGQTPRPKSETPVLPSEEESVRLDKNLRQFYAVRDDAPFRYRGKEMGGVPEINAANDELEAYNYTIEFAARKDPALLKKYSDKKVPWGNLYGDIRHDYLRELLHFEGKMVFLAPFKPTDNLVAAGISTLYEAWLYPKGSPELICLVVTEVPKGIEPGENLNVWVSFDAYYFKYMQYQSRQEKPKEKQTGGADKQQWRRAPLFIGRTFEKIDVVEAEVSFFSGGMFYGVVGALLVLITVGAALSYWFRRGDRAIKEASHRRIQDGVQFENLTEQSTPPQAGHEQ